MTKALKIKVCGNREVNNLKQVAGLNPDYIGFVFYPKSKRVVLAPGDSFKGLNNVKRVGVFVNATKREIEENTEAYKLDFIQLHGDETPEFCSKIAQIRPVFKAFQINNNFNFSKLNNYLSICYGFVFDATTKHYGGSGKQFDWSKLKEYKWGKPFLLSGGIGPNDIEKIKAFDHPALYGIDINSQFEIEPGVKDINKLEDFFKRLGR